MKHQQKIALAAVALISGSAMAADSSVTVYGLVDMGYAYRTDNYDASKSGRNGFDSGIASGSRLGFRGVEEISPGLKGKFVIEAGINADQGSAAQGGAAWGRQSWVGLDAGVVEARLGRQYSPEYLIYGDIDPFSHGQVAKASNIFQHVKTYDRINNGFYVTTPYFGDVFSVDAIYSFNRGGDEAVANAGDKRFYAIAPKLQFGKMFKVVANYSHDYDKAKYTTDTVVELGAIVDFGVAKISGAYAQPKLESAPVGAAKEPKKYNRYLLGATVPFGNFSLLASYAYSKDKNDLDEKATQIGIGGTYAFSKRTDMYLGFARIDADDKIGVKYGVSDGSNTFNDYRSGFNLGVRHKF
ncbi:porin [Niveibacterium sp.]|uniref:porin n=1 Tax=Niveibacterium sp. TaxID=2017444 RepID=UPI0035B3F055